MNKKIFSGLAALALVFSGAGALPAETFEGFSLTVSAADIVKSGTCGENLTWELDSEGTLIIDGTGDMEKYGYGESPWFNIKKEIKKIILKNGVTSIGNNAFASCPNVESVTIPDGVTRIGRFAFDSCTGLESITIPDSVTTISNNAFEFCGFKSITIPNSVTVINSGMFISCSKLKSVSLPDSVTGIGRQAFYGCTSLESITIPNTVKSIGYKAYAGCTLSASVIIPASVKTIGEKAFGYKHLNECDKVAGYKIKGYKSTAAETYASENGFEFIALDETADKYPVVKSAVQGRQFRLKWTAVPNAEKYGLAVYQSGKWRVKVQFAGNVTSYTSPKMKAGTYRMVVCAKVNGEWDTSSISKRSFKITIE